MWIVGCVDPKACVATRTAHDLTLADLQVPGIPRVIVVLIVKISVDGCQRLPDFMGQMFDLLGNRAHSQRPPVTQSRAKPKVMMGTFDSKYVD